MNHPKIPVNLDWLHEKIERAMRATRNKDEINNLFLVVPIGKGSEGDIKIDTKYGALRVFFSSELMEFYKYGCEKPRILLLNKRRFDYPNISKVSTRRIEVIKDLKPYLN